MDAEDWDRFFARRELVLARDPNPIIVELVSPLPAGRALELGAGEGRNALLRRPQVETLRGVQLVSPFPCVCIASCAASADDDIIELWRVRAAP